MGVADGTVVGIHREVCLLHVADETGFAWKAFATVRAVKEAVLWAVMHNSHVALKVVHVTKPSPTQRTLKLALLPRMHYRMAVQLRLSVKLLPAHVTRHSLDSPVDFPHMLFEGGCPLKSGGTVVASVGLARSQMDGTHMSLEGNCVVERLATVGTGEAACPVMLSVFVVLQAKSVLTLHTTHPTLDTLQWLHAQQILAQVLLMRVELSRVHGHACVVTKPTLAVLAYGHLIIVAFTTGKCGSVTLHHKCPDPFPPPSPRQLRSKCRCRQLRLSLTGKGYTVFWFTIEGG